MRVRLAERGNWRSRLRACVLVSSSAGFANALKHEACSQPHRVRGIVLASQNPVDIVQRLTGVERGCRFCKILCWLALKDDHQRNSIRYRDKLSVAQVTRVILIAHAILVKLAWAPV